MTGWLALAALVAFGLGAFRLLGLRGAMLQLAAAALLLGAAGYALHGRPGVPSSEQEAQASRQAIPLGNARRAFFGELGGSNHWLMMSDSMAGRGKTADAAGILRSAVREHPGDPVLWIGLGNALVDHVGVLTPAAQLAYERAASLSPGHPAPPFFYGVALARSGEREAAVRLWRQILADASAEAGWRPLVEDAVAALGNPPQR
jgi:cytochrome c-type biogenesis protein CcmH/NrfG